MRYTTTEKELLAAIFGVKHFRPYLFGRKFTIITDRKALEWIHKLKDPTMSSRLARWKIKLQEYDNEIVYRPGRVNANADALSSNPISEIKFLESKSNFQISNSEEVIEKSDLLNEFFIEKVFITTYGEKGKEEEWEKLEETMKKQELEILKDKKEKINEIEIVRNGKDGLNYIKRN